MNRFATCIGLLVVLTSASFAQDSSEKEISRIAFGSCARESLEQPIWKTVLQAEPQVWIWLGDNVYGDTEDSNILAAKYAALKAKPGYTALREICEVVGTWDDHDFGVNNGGKEYAAKGMSQQALLDFLDTPKDSSRRKQEGVYWSHTYGQGDRQVKIILLDCRYHRDDPSDSNGDILGKAQWAWLEQQLRGSQARLNIVASGIQVIPEDHRYEKWAQFPKARKRLFDLIRDSRAKGVVFLSGDRHIAEISRVNLEGLSYGLYDVTSSSLTHSWTSFPGELNRHRVGEVFSENNFGLIEVDWNNGVASISIRNIEGKSQRNVEIRL